MHQFSGTLKVNLSALRRNWRFMRDSFTGQHCGAVVKANAYGLGVAPVTQALYREGCRHFFVATFDEALEVKRLIPEKVDIFVLQGCYPGAEQNFIDEEIMPVISSFAMLERWIKVSAAGQRRCALKINTGMNRLGLTVPEFVAALCADSALLSRAGVELLVSHLACADEPAHPLNRVQLSRFREAVAEARLHEPSIRASLANSAGILLGEDWHFNVARPGIALYGGCCVPQLRGHLSPVASLQLPVMQILDVRAGESIGYGGDFIARTDMRIAVVSGGYADGIFRSFVGGLKGWFHQELLSVGRISMDSCAFDITHLAPELSPELGDLVEIIGEHCPLDDQASAAGTISYELLTRLGDRFQKVYFEE